MRKSYPRCLQLLNTCNKYPSSLTCVPAGIYCESYTKGPFDKTGLNPYDIRLQCPSNATLCYEILDGLQKFANLPEVRDELGVDEEAGDYLSCNDNVGFRFHMGGDP